jgi:alkane 1-monooxygenase
MQLLMFLLFVVTQQYTWTDSFVMGFIMALGINVAHELIHKHQPVFQWFGKRLLEWCGYGFWEWQHIMGHHKNVGTIHDPASASKGVTVYEFLPHCIFGTVQQAWQLNSQKFQKTIANTFFLQLFLFTIFGKRVGIFHMTSCCFSILFLEIINYLEHYGLHRSSDERVEQFHSWDAPYTWSSLILFKLPFHSDHHLHARKNFSELEIQTLSPKYPFSYPAMIIISLVPPLFFRLTHHELANHPPTL